MTPLVPCPDTFVHSIRVLSKRCLMCRGTGHVPASFAVELALIGLDLNRNAWPDRFAVPFRLYLYELKLRHAAHGAPEWTKRDRAYLAEYGAHFNGDWRRQLATYNPEDHTLEELEERFPRA